MQSKILVVDDEPNIVELNRMYLESAGYQVVPWELKRFLTTDFTDISDQAGRFRVQYL